MNDDLDLSALRVFRAVSRAGSFAEAARALNLPKSTVSKRVRDLEVSLAVRLIERTTRQMRVTPEGELLAQRADRLLAEAEDIRRNITLATSEPTGHLRIAVPAFFGNMFIGGIATLCRQRNPELTLEFAFLDRLPDLLEEGFDGAVAFGPLADSDAVMRRVADVQLVPVAAPGLAGLSALSMPEDLLDVDLITHGLRRNTWVFERAAEQRTVDVTGVLTFGSPLASRDAALSGAGATLLPAMLAAPHIADGSLVRLLPQWQGLRREMYFLYPSPQSMTARLRAFLDILLEQVEFAPVSETAEGRAAE